jgi:thiaminase
MTIPQEIKLVGAEAGTTSARLYTAAESIWSAQLEHPFVKALGDGSLPRSNFEYYIRQDARFLGLRFISDNASVSPPFQGNYI